MELETDTTIKNLVTITIYNWRSAGTTNSLAFLAVLHMWNIIGHADDNGESSALHCYLLQSNLDLGHIQVDRGLINNIDSETLTLWQTIINASTSTTSYANAEMEDNIADFIQSRPAQVDMEFFQTLSNDIQPFVRSQQLDFIGWKLGMLISQFIEKVKANPFSL